MPPNETSDSKRGGSDRSCAAIASSSSRGCSSNMGSRECSINSNSSASSGRSVSSKVEQQQYSAVVGTNLSRFLGFYNPAFDKSYTSKSDIEDKGSNEIKQYLADEAKELNKTANRKKDWMKEYLDEKPIADANITFSKN